MQGLVCKGIFLSHKWVSCFGKMEGKKSTVYLADEAGTSAQGCGTIWQRGKCDGLKGENCKDLWDRWRVEMNEISRPGRKRTWGSMRCEHGMCQEAGCLPVTGITSWRHFCSAKWRAALFPVKDASAWGDSPFWKPVPLSLPLSLYRYCYFVNV